MLSEKYLQYLIRANNSYLSSLKKTHNNNIVEGNIDNAITAEIVLGEMINEKMTFMLEKEKLQEEAG